MPLKISWLALSAWPLEWGWATDETSRRICSRWQKSFIAPLDRLVPLSVIVWKWWCNYIGKFGWFYQFRWQCCVHWLGVTDWAIYLKFHHCKVYESWIKPLCLSGFIWLFNFSWVFKRLVREDSKLKMATYRSPFFILLNWLYFAMFYFDMDKLF